MIAIYERMNIKRAIACVGLVLFLAASLAANATSLPATEQTTGLRELGLPRAQSGATTRDESVSLHVSLDGMAEVSYTLTSYEVPLGLDVNILSLDLREVLLHATVAVSPTYEEHGNAVLQIALDTDDADFAVSLALEAFALVSDTASEEFFVQQVLLPEEGPWGSNQAAVVSLTGYVDYSYYFSALNDEFSGFSDGIPSQVNLGAITPTVVVGAGRDYGIGTDFFSVLGYSQKTPAASLAGHHSYDLASLLGVSSLEPTGNQPSLYADIGVPFDVTNFVVDPAENDTSTTVNIGVHGDQLKVQIWTFSDAVLGNVNVDFDYTFVPEEMQGSEILSVSLSPHGYLTKTYIGTGEDLVIPSAAYELLKTDSLYENVTSMTVSVITDLENTTIEDYTWVNLKVVVTEEGSDFDVVNGLQQSVAAEIGWSLPSVYNGTQIMGVNHITSEFDILHEYSWEFWKGAGFTDSGLDILNNTSAWNVSSIVPQMNYECGDYFVASEIVRHEMYPDVWIPKLYISWAGVQTWSDAPTPAFEPGTPSVFLNLTNTFGITEFNVTPGFSVLLITYTVPYDIEQGKPVFSPEQPGIGYTTFMVETEGQMMFTEPVNETMAQKMWMIDSENPQVIVGEETIPLTDLNVTVPYTILDNTTDITCPSFARLGFEADSEFVTDHLTSPPYSVYDNFVYGNDMHVLARFNGTETLYPLIHDYYGFYAPHNMTGLETIEDIFGNDDAFWQWVFPSSGITDVWLTFTPEDIPVSDSGPFRVHAVAEANESVVWYSSLYDENGTIVDAGGPSLAQFSEYEWDTTTMADGNWILEIEARDTAGNVGSSTVCVLVDNYATAGSPTVSIEASSDIYEGATLTEDGVLRITAVEDTSPIYGAVVSFMGDTHTMTYNDGLDCFEWDLSVGQAYSGSHIVVVTVVDLSGARQGLTINFGIDIGQAPIIESLLPADGSTFLLTDEIVVQVTANDPDGTALTVTLSLDSQTSGSMSQTGSNTWEYTIAPGTFDTGSHTIDVTVTDSDVYVKQTQQRTRVEIEEEVTATFSSSSPPSLTTSATSTDTGGGDEDDGGLIPGYQLSVPLLCAIAVSVIFARKRRK